MENEEILRIEKDVEGFLTVNINDTVAWPISDELRKLILDECQEHLGGDFADEFDPIIQKAIDNISSNLE